MNELFFTENEFDFAAAVERTKAFIEAGKEILYEAAFVADDTLVLADILVKTKNANLIYEKLIENKNYDLTTVYIKKADIIDLHNYGQNLYIGNLRYKFEIFPWY